MKLIVSYNPDKDAENHVRAICDSTYLAHGRQDMKEKLLASVESDAIRSALSSGGSREEIKAMVTKLLSEAPGRAVLDEKAKKLEAAWGSLGDQVIFQIESIYDKDWPFDEIYVDLTTLPICPYDYKGRRIFVHALPSPQAQLRILSHELNHFMFYDTYAGGLVATLDREKLELLKESLTIFTNPEQEGKPNERPLRGYFLEKRIRSVEEAVAAGKEFLAGA